MSKKFLVILSLLFFVGCAGQQIVSVKPLNPFEPPAINPNTGKSTCTIYEDMGITGGLIYEKILNPCAAQNILVTVAQGAYALEGYKISQFKMWTDRLRMNMTGGISYTAFRALVLREVLDWNKNMGLVLFSASGLIDIFEGQALLHCDDIKLLNASLDDLVRQVEVLQILEDSR